MATKKDNLEVVETTEYKSVHARLIEAKKGFGKAGKTADNPHLKSKYADLSSVLEAVTDSLTSAGLYVHQVVVEAGLHTSIVSCDGESIDFGIMPILASKQDAQGYGSGLTYARRYSIMNACGIAPEDDDGAKAVETYKAPPKQAPQQAQPSPKRELLSAGISAMVADLQKKVSIDPSFWGARYGASTATMTDAQLEVVSEDIKSIMSHLYVVVDGDTVTIKQNEEFMQSLELFGGFQ
jgi:hypothetical protein